MRILPLLLAMVLPLAACTRHEAAAPPTIPGDGKRIAEGKVSEVRPSPDGAAVAWLADLGRPKEFGLRLPEHVMAGRAFVGAASGTPPAVLVAEGVTNLPGSFSFSPDGEEMGALGGWDYKKQEGTLRVADVRSGKVRDVAPGVSYFAFGRKGHLAYVAGGKLVVEAPHAGESAAAAEGVGTVDFSPSGDRLLVRKRFVDGGGLLLMNLEKQVPPVALGTQVADYNWSPDGSGVAFTARNLDTFGYDLFLVEGEGKPKKLGTGVPGYAFSSDGKHLAFIGNVTPEKQYGQLFEYTPGTDAPRKLGESVNTYAFAHGGDRLAWIQNYDARSRVGTLAWVTSGQGEPVKVSPESSAFLWSRTGQYLAFLKRETKPVFSVDLYLHEAKPLGSTTLLTKGAFGFDFTKDDATVLFRANCTRGGRSCDLLAVPPGKPAQTPLEIAHGVNTFEFAPGSLDVLMLTYARFDAEAFDLALVPADGSAPAHTVDRYVVPGTRFLGPHGERVTYGVMEKGREGVYVADVPDLKALAAKEKAQGGE
jgi:hypothetical protein